MRLFWVPSRCHSLAPGRQGGPRTARFPSESRSPPRSWGLGRARRNGTASSAKSLAIRSLPRNCLRHCRGTGRCRSTRSRQRVALWIDLENRRLRIERRPGDQWKAEWKAIVYDGQELRGFERPGPALPCPRADAVRLLRSSPIGLCCSATVSRGPEGRIVPSNLRRTYERRNYEVTAVETPRLTVAIKAVARRSWSRRVRHRRVPKGTDRGRPPAGGTDASPTNCSMPPASPSSWRRCRENGSTKRSRTGGSWSFPSTPSRSGIGRRFLEDGFRRSRVVNRRGDFFPLANAGRSDAHFAGSGFLEVE